MSKAPSPRVRAIETRFREHMLGNLTVAAVVLVISLAIGMTGYHSLVPGLSWMDAFVNSAMLLSGMGPLAIPQTDGAKLFAGAYALFSGLAVLAIAGIIFAPAIHRLLHYLHADPGDRQRGQTRSGT